MSKELTGAQTLLKCLQDADIEILVGYTGGAIMPTFDTLPQFPGLRFITCRHEQGAGFLAQGYTRASGKLAPVLVTSGPGATNTVTAVADAMMDSVPMLNITGQVSTNVIGSDAFQETDVTGLMYPITKHSTMPLHADEIAEQLSELIYIATHGRKGPVNFDIPKDVQLQKTENIELNLDPYLPGFQDEKFELTENIQKGIDSAINLIKKAKRPVALVGHGVILSDSGKELKEFLEKSGVPATFTLHGLSSLPDSHQLNLGMMGMHGEIAANRAIRDADLLIALGMRFDDRVTGKLSEYAKDAKVIHIELDKSEIHKNVYADVPINANLKDVLPLITDGIDFVRDTTEQLNSIEKNKIEGQKFYQEIFEKGVGKNGKILMSRVISDLSALTNGQDNIVTDVGQHQMFSAKFYKFNRFNSWFTSGGLGTMGFGIPAAIGVKLARPDEEVWCISGDGGIQMNIQELATIAQENININILLLNNNYLGMVRQWQELFHEERYVQTRMLTPDFSLLSQAYGVAYKKVEKIHQISESLDWARQQNGPSFIEFICDDSELVWPMLPPGGTLHDIIENEEMAKKKLNKNK